jgi:hypothetical protein
MTTRHDRHYTLDEARAELPWVTRQLVAMRDARDRLTDAQAREALTERSPTNGGGKPGRQVGEAFLELQAGASAFDDRGIVLRDLDRGLIDFPTLREGAEVYLCWQEGEDEIAFWHQPEAGFAGRQPLNDG